MKIHEYQAKEILRRHNANVPFGVMIDSLLAAEKAVEQVNKYSTTIVVKAQIHAGGRGKGGGVKVTKSISEALTAAKSILGMTLITHQTGPEGKKVNRLYFEEGINIDKEFYLSILLDRSINQNIIMASTEGGMEIEEVANKSPEKILKIAIDSGIGIQPCQVRELGYALGLAGDALKSFAGFLPNLYEAYIKEDCSLLEINPLILTREEKDFAGAIIKKAEIIAGDAKITLDDNASFRHPDNIAYRDLTEEDPLEIKAEESHLNYIRLDGTIGCMVNGAGLAMATMDIIKLSGADPANFLDVGGTASAETVREGFKIILSEKQVKGIFINIFGGIVRCDRVANGIIDAAHSEKIGVPLVVRLQGTNSIEAKQILKDSKLAIIAVDELHDAAKEIAKIANGL